ncbi:hypothetical protein [Saccharothrix xinjiangensis]|uniref:Uncharacterized protein n=1 Tax=Saccharothrix xinjiangensis TaxID=204798 RepID=A0ABV9YBX8_9PSEU
MGEADVARRAWAAPLLFFGVATLLVLPLYRPGGSGRRGGDVLSQAVNLPDLRHPTAVGLYWVAVLLVGAWVVARGLGYATPAGAYLAAAGVGWAALPASTALHDLPRWWTGTGTGVILLAAAAALWRRGVLYPTLVVALLGAAVLVASHPAVGPLIALGVGLFALADAVPDNALRTTVAAFAVALCLSAAAAPVEAGSAWALAGPLALPGLVLVLGGAVGLRRPAVRVGSSLRA